MKIIEIPAERFNNLTQDHPLISFQQTSNWAKLKAFTGWIAYYVGYGDDEDHCVAFSLILGKKMPLFNKYLFYAPHGYLCDYADRELLKAFHTDLIAFLKAKGGFQIIIDPYLPYRQRDINGTIVPDGFNNQKAVDHLIALGYHHTGFNLYYENLQPRFLFRLDLRGQSIEVIFKNFRYETKRRAKRKDFLAIEIKELGYDEIGIYKQLMAKTAKRKGFLDRSLSYYQQMYDAMHDDGILHYYVAEINFEKCAANVNEAINKSYQRIERLQSRNNNRHNENVIHEEEIVLNANRQLLTVIEEGRKEYGDHAALSGVTLITYGKEAIMLLAGNDEKYLQHFMTSNIIVSELIKLAKEQGYDYYNFYGITGDFDPQSPHYGLYAYKKQYGGEVVELIGQFEYTLSPVIKKLYDLGMKVYNLSKSLRS